jgi:hypothetical protein
MKLLAIVAIAVLVVITVLAVIALYSIDISGYWMSDRTGKMFKLSRTEFNKFQWTSGGIEGDGQMMARTIQIGNERGIVKYGGRRIVWNNGDFWTAQGVLE